MLKKKVISLALAAVIGVMAIAGASLAYFTDTGTARNAFTMGSVKIVLDETDIRSPTGDRVSANEYGIGDVYPGAVLTKDPIVHNTGKNPAYIRAIVTVENGVNWLGLYNENTAAAPQEAAFTALIDNTLGAGWVLEDIAYDMSSPDHPTSDFVATLRYRDPGPRGGHYGHVLPPLHPGKAHGKRRDHPHLPERGIPHRRGGPGHPDQRLCQLGRGLCRL